MRSNASAFCSYGYLGYQKGSVRTRLWRLEPAGSTQYVNLTIPFSGAEENDYAFLAEKAFLLDYVFDMYITQICGVIPAPETWKTVSYTTT